MAEFAEIYNSTVCCVLYAVYCMLCTVYRHILKISAIYAISAGPKLSISTGKNSISAGLLFRYF